MEETFDPLAKYKAQFYAKPTDQKPAIAASRRPAAMPPQTLCLDPNESPVDLFRLAQAQRRLRTNLLMLYNIYAFFFIILALHLKGLANLFPNPVFGLVLALILLMLIWLTFYLPYCVYVACAAMQWAHWKRVVLTILMFVHYIHFAIPDVVNRAITKRLKLAGIPVGWLGVSKQHLRELKWLAQMQSLTTEEVQIQAIIQLHNRIATHLSTPTPTPTPSRNTDPLL